MCLIDMSCLVENIEGEKLITEKVGATKNVAWRFHQDNIRCNGVLPGGMSLISFSSHTTN